MRGLSLFLQVYTAPSQSVADDHTWTVLNACGLQASFSYLIRQCLFDVHCEYPRAVHSPRWCLIRLCSWFSTRKGRIRLLIVCWFGDSGVHFVQEHIEVHLISWSAQVTAVRKGSNGHLVDVIDVNDPKVLLQAPFLLLNKSQCLSVHCIRMLMS